MDSRVDSCSTLTERDVALLHRIESGLAISADVSRADFLLCCLLRPDEILVASHAAPHSISSIYVSSATGRTFSTNAQPLVMRALSEDRVGAREKQILSSGAPVIQQVYPIHNAANRVVAALLIETNMIEHERHRRRDKSFRRAVRWLQEMAIRGEIEIPSELQGFGAFDGIYLVDENARLLYMSGIATNLYRSIGLVRDMRGEPISTLESEDEEIVEQAVQSFRCVQVRNENEDGRVWVRTAIPLRAPTGTMHDLRSRLARRLPWIQSGTAEGFPMVDGALVLVHNATESVQRERELNVKSAIIQEVHHRVKNNLQTIAAVLRIQARRCESDEARHHLSDAVNRILSMSVIHEYLSQDEHRPINIRDVCQRIVAQTRQVAVNPGQEITIDLEGPNIRLPAGQATAAALVINELLLNAVKHGLEGRKSGHISITLEDTGDSVQIAVCDDGLGLPDDFSLEESGSLGLQIIQTLVTDDLKGQLEFGAARELDSASENGIASNKGTRVEVFFPKRSVSLETVSV